tara:strand:+ start:311 stop:577 length:267 start_codon:yes stop_codon:yes gene_type:complete
MCFGGGGSPAVQNTPAPIRQRNPDLTRASNLPERRELVEDDDLPSVEYGSGKKDDGSNFERRVGAASLRIPLNLGGSGMTKGGGVNKP